MTLDDFYSFAGVPLPEIVRQMHRKQLSSEATEQFVNDFLAAKQAAHVRHESSRGHPAAIDCVVELAREAAGRGVPVCIATSGLRSHVEAHLSAAHLDDLFNAQKGNIVCAADVPHGKPAPDIFIEAARRIGVAPSRCRAFEDGESGLQAAYAAGCHVIDVTFMDRYPMVEGLRQTKKRDYAERMWHCS
jgi:HAD superfamily hydrolase (TIGR01509 family)